MDNPSYSSKEELLKACSGGDEKAWADFVEEFTPLIRWAIKRKISRSFDFVDDGDISDIFQMTFAHIWSNNRLTSLKNPGSISAYLTIIAQNLTIDFFRKKKRLMRLKSRKLTEENPCMASNPRTESYNRQIEEDIQEQINGLPLKERRIMELDIFYDLKHREISEMMEISINTVSTVIARARESLKEKLKERGYDV